MIAHHVYPVIKAIGKKFIFTMYSKYKRPYQLMLLVLLINSVHFVQAATMPSNGAEPEKKSASKVFNRAPNDHHSLPTNLPHYFEEKKEEDYKDDEDRETVVSNLSLSNLRSPSIASNNSEHKITINDIELADIATINKKLFENLCKIMERLDQDIEKAFTNLDYSLLQETFRDVNLLDKREKLLGDEKEKVFKKNNNLYGMVEEYFTTHKNSKYCFISKRVSYSEIKKKINRKLQTLFKQLCKEDILTKSFDSRKQADIFYERLNKQLFFIEAAEKDENIHTSAIINFKKLCNIQGRRIKNYIPNYITSLPIDEDWELATYQKINQCLEALQHIEEHVTQVEKFKEAINPGQFSQDIKKRLQKKEQTLTKKAMHKNANTDTIAYAIVELKKMEEILTIREQGTIVKEIDQVLKTCKKENKKAFKNLSAKLSALPCSEGARIIDTSPFFKKERLIQIITKTGYYDEEYVLKYITGEKLDKDKLITRYSLYLKYYEDLILQQMKGQTDLNKIKGDINMLLGRERTKARNNYLKQLSNILNEESPKNISIIRQKAGEPCLVSFPLCLKYNEYLKEIDLQCSSKLQDKIIPQLMAQVAAVWTLQNRDDDDDENNQENDYLLKPHPAQVISIFRLLDLDHKKGSAFPNNLVQIGTGEGKSVVMAITSIILALLGFNVTCGCYSPYLKNRDYKAFLPLFKGLKLDNNAIKYSTFNDIAEDTIKQKVGDIRKKIAQLFTPQANNYQEDYKEEEEEKSAIDNRQELPNIFIVDEVDVFFHKSFYGNVYQISVPLRHSAINALVKYIWKNYRNIVAFSLATLVEIEQSAPYIRCQAGPFKNWEALLQEQVKDLLYGLQHFQENHDYIVHNNQIGYKEHDHINYNIRIGYKTLFAYFYEHEQNPKKISRGSLENNIALNIRCGTISYAELPIEFKRIFGVTGTLKELSKQQRATIKGKYKIKKYTYMPSIYGESKRKYSGIDIVSALDYPITIAKRIEEGLVGIQGGKRAALVFFENKKALDDFKGSKNYKVLKLKLTVAPQVMTEELTDVEKELRIQNATTRGMVTLAISDFGRGTDYKCFDKIVNSNGGVYLLITFWPDEPSAHTQIEGRTARQSDNGTIHYVIKKDSLEQFKFTQREIDDLANDTYINKNDILTKKRNLAFEKTSKEDTEAIEKAKEAHKATMQFLKDLRANRRKDIYKYLLDQNRGAAIIRNSRTIVLMDATGSMGGLMQKAKNRVYDMFTRIEKILIDKYFDPKVFEMQFAVYRNYDQPANKLLCTSPWTCKSDELNQFMQTIAAGGGWGVQEAVEIGLAHALREHRKNKITQVILIGDAISNSKNDVVRKRKSRGEEYWGQFPQFQAPTYYKDELQKLQAANIPVHAFYIPGNPTTLAPHYKEIADTTGGTTDKLDINSSDGLTDLVSQTVLHNVGGDDKGAELVQAYRKTYMGAR